MDDIQRLQIKIADREAQIRKLKDQNDQDRKKLGRLTGTKKGFWDW